MPLYEFECPRCGRREEVLERDISIDPNLLAPTCYHPFKGSVPGGDDVIMGRTASVSHAHFKGPGWSN